MDLDEPNRPKLPPKILIKCDIPCEPHGLHLRQPPHRRSILRHDMLVQRGQRELGHQIDAIGNAGSVVLAATSRARSVASAPPRLWPQMVNEVKGLGQGRPARTCARRGELEAPVVVMDMYMAVKPSSVLPALGRKGQWTDKNIASWIHS
jgi:hypothetical protein